LLLLPGKRPNNDWFLVFDRVGSAGFAIIAFYGIGKDWIFFGFHRDIKVLKAQISKKSRS
jgi:hypothetical protein